MSHTELFSSLLSLEQPLLTSLCSSPSSQPKTSKKSKKSSSSITSDSDDSMIERKRPPPMQQRKRKYQDDVVIDGDTPLNKKLRRQQQNRQAAHTSRIKKKAQMEALQQQVNDLIEANRLLQAKVASLTSEITANRQILASSTPITIMESPISIASSHEPTSPESPISPIPHANIQTPLSDSESSMDTSSVTESTMSPPLVMPSLTIPSTTSITIPTSTPVADVIPSSPRCSDSAVVILSPQCQRVESGINNNNHQSSQAQPTLTWPQFMTLMCILHMIHGWIQNSHKSLSPPSPHPQANTLRLNPSPSLISPIIPSPCLTPLTENMSTSHVISTCTTYPPAQIVCAFLMCMFISRTHSSWGMKVS